MKTYNIFLSHRWKNNDEYKKIVEWLKNPNYAIFKMYSVSKDEVEKNDWIKTTLLKNNIRDRISKSSIFIAFNDKSYSSKIFNWSQFELKIARELGKKILVIKRQSMYEIPHPLKENDGEVNWTGKSIVSIIKNLCND